MILKVTKIKQETNNSFSIFFEKPMGFSFYPGQYLDIELPVKDPGGKTRIMSISSSPSEDFLMITYKLGITPYKKFMETLKPEDIVESSHPAGTVVIDDSSPAFLMAGGIGIAPHRSMIKWALDRKLDLPITLIYSNSDSDFIFKKDLNKWQKQYPNLTIHYVITGKDGHLTEEKLKTLSPTFCQGKKQALLIPYPLSSIFYLAGPPKMVNDFENILLKLGMDSINIRTDRFDGY